MFGAASPAGAAGPPGTSAVPYSASSKTDGNTVINLQTITAMPAYEAKSPEELRLEDYMAGNKGRMGQPGAPAPATGAFGAPAAPAPAFGAAPAPAPAFGGFGAPAPAPAGGLFGAPAPAPVGGGLFGAAPAPAPTGGGLFGAPAPAAPAPAFGGFGAASLAPAPAPGGLFGAPAPAPAAGGLFGAPAPAPGGGGLFGAPAPAPAGGLFGSPPPTVPAPAATPTSVAPPPTAEALLEQQFAALKNQKKELALYDAWRGQAPSGSSVIPTSLSEREATGRGSGPSDSGGAAAASNRSAAYAASSGLFLAYQAAPRSTAKIRPRGFAPAKSPAVIGKMGAGGASPMMSPDAYLGSSAKRLTIRPGSLTPKPKMRLLLTDGNGDEKKEETPAPSTNGVGNNTSAQRDTPASAARGAGATIGTNTPTAPPFASPLAASSPSPHVAPSPAKESATPPASAGSRQSPASSSKKSGGAGYDFYRTIVGENGTTPAASSNFPAYVPKLTKGDGYSVSPSIEAMGQMSEADLAAVSNFVVSREGLGSIAWEGAVDVRGVDLDSVVQIKFRDVAVYDAEEENGTKPPLGSKLNRPAVITMYDVFPKDGGADATEEARSKFEKRISKSTKKMGAELISYNAERGVWKFRVLHFSRYNLDDSDDEQEETQVEEMAVEPAAAVDTAATTSVQESSDFEKRGRGGRPRAIERRSGGRSTRLAYLDDDDEEDEEDDDAMMSETDDEDSSSTGALTSEAEGGQSDGGEHREMEASLQQADNAYAMLSLQMEADEGDVGPAAGFEEPSIFHDEGEGASEHCFPAQPPAVLEPEAAPVIPPSEGISARLARKYGVETTTSSKTDFGLRMGRSFRVGWRPDGSFLYPRVSQSSTSTLNSVQICQARPVIGSVEDSLPLLQVHLKNSVADSTTDGCPTYSLPSIANSSDSSLSSEGPYSALCSALDEYSSESADNSVGNDEMSDPEVPKVVPRAFSLLSTLYGREENGETNVCNERRAEGVKIWLRNATSNDMIASIKSSKNRGKLLQAIYDALSGGNIAKASSLAIENGHLRLATLITCNDLQTRLDMLEQMEMTGQAPSLPSELRRIYALLGGDLREEEGISQASPTFPATLDWRRRLILRIMFSSDDASLPAVLQEVEGDIERRVFPQPNPRHHTSGPSQDDCILYQMLQVWASNSGPTSPSQAPLSSLINPLTHTSSEHDFSMSFHLTSALSAVGCCVPLSVVDEARLMDSYVNQLLSVGLWEWAVYVCICSCAVSSTRGDLKELWQHRAADIISRFYHSASDVGSNARSFLEGKVGIPSEWFDSATAIKCLFGGDQRGYISAISQMDPSEALRCYEDELLPTLLFNGLTGDYESKIFCLHDSDELSVKTDSVTRKIIELSQEVLKLSQGEQMDATAAIPELQYEANELRRRLIEENASLTLATSTTKKITGDLWPAHFAEDGGMKMKRVPLTVFYAEASAWVALLQLQLAALAAGQSIFDNDALYGSSERQRLKYASQLSHLCVHNNVSALDISEPFLGARDFTRGMA